MLGEVLDEATIRPVIELLVLLIEADASSVHHSEVAPHVVHIFDSNVSDVHLDYQVLWIRNCLEVFEEFWVVHHDTHHA